MALEPEKGGKLPHGRLQPTLPARTKTRGLPSRLMEPQGCSDRESLAGAKRPFLLREAQKGWRICFA
jgi:hypothetical protein